MSSTLTLPRPADPAPPPASYPAFWEAPEDKYRGRLFPKSTGDFDCSIRRIEDAYFAALDSTHCGFILSVKETPREYSWGVERLGAIIDALVRPAHGEDDEAQKRYAIGLGIELGRMIAGGALRVEDVKSRLSSASLGRKILKRVRYGINRGRTCRWYSPITTPMELMFLDENSRKPDFAETARVWFEASLVKLSNMEGLSPTKRATVIAVLNALRMMVAKYGPTFKASHRMLAGLANRSAMTISSYRRLILEFVEITHKPKRYALQDATGYQIKRTWEQVDPELLDRAVESKTERSMSAPDFGFVPLVQYVKKTSPFSLVDSFQRTQVALTWGYLMSSDGPRTPKEASSDLGISAETARRHMKKLASEEWAVSAGPRKGFSGQIGSQTRDLLAARRARNLQQRVKYEETVFASYADDLYDRGLLSLTDEKEYRRWQQRAESRWWEEDGVRDKRSKRKMGLDQTARCTPGAFMVARREGVMDSTGEVIKAETAKEWFSLIVEEFKLVVH